MIKNQQTNGHWVSSANFKLMNQAFVKLDTSTVKTTFVGLTMSTLSLFWWNLLMFSTFNCHPIQMIQSSKQEWLKIWKQFMNWKSWGLYAKSLGIYSLVISHSLSNSLYDLYTLVIDPGKLWKALELKYKAYEEGTNKYLIVKYPISKWSMKELFVEWKCLRSEINWYTFVE